MIFMDSTMLDVGRVPQYFFDNLVIEQIQNLTRIVHNPRKEAGPLIKKDRPWEHVTYFTCNAWNVFRDGSSGKFRCWYEDWDFDQQEYFRWDKEGKPHPRSARTRLCYAHSDDGLNWEKPALDYREEKGCKTNIIFGNPSFGSVHAATILDDPLECDLEKRFKMVFEHYSDHWHMEVASSGDGMKWNPYTEPPIFGGRGLNPGDVETLMADVEARVYRLTTRHWHMCTVFHDKRRPKTKGPAPIFPHDPGRMSKRRIYQSISSDLIHWSTPQCILALDDEEDNLDESYYGMVQFRLGDLYVGLLNVFRQVANTLSVRLVYSRDGWRWYHLNQRQPWLAPSEDSWDRYMVNIPNVPLPAGDKLLVYYGGAKNHHDWWIKGLGEGLQVPEAHSLDEVSYCLGLAKLRLDGFISIDAGPVRDGVLITRVLKTDGRRLVLNAVCANGGSIEVEATDAHEHVLTGYSRAECDTFSGDSTRAIITWKGKATISHNGYLRLRFFMRNASLYSFTLDQRPGQGTTSASFD